MPPAELITTAGRAWKVNPFLHVESGRIYNPLTDAAIGAEHPAYPFLSGATPEAPPDGDALLRDGWMVAEGADLSTRHRLKIVSLEVMTTCNQKCYFCPVSVAPREDYTMPEPLFGSILEQLTAFRPTLEAVFLQSYNEPTLDRQFVEHVRAIHDAGLPVAVLSNGSAFTPAKTDALLAHAPLRYLCINLSTIDRERYAADRGADHLQAVLRNLDYMRDKPVAAQMNMVVLGTGNDIHRRDFEEVRDHFAGSRFDVQFHTVMDRAGWLDVGSRPPEPIARLAGCDNVGSRPLQHLHITPQGRCVLCCEDYDENYVVGDLTQSTITEVLEGPELARMRRWVYGLEEAPAGFMCRNCVFARSR